MSFEKIMLELFPKKGLSDLGKIKPRILKPKAPTEIKIGEPHQIGDTVHFSTAAPKIDLKPAELNRETGLPVARNVFEVPKAPEGWVSLSHCSRGAAEGIKEHGLFSTYADIDSTAFVQDLSDLLEEFSKNPLARAHYGDDIMIFHMPYKEFKLVNYKNRHYARNLDEKPNLNWDSLKLMIPKRYLVAHLERKDIVNLTTEQIKLASASQPAPLRIQPTDLRHLNPGASKTISPTDLDWFEIKVFNKYKSLAQQEPQIEITDNEIAGMCRNGGSVRKETPAMKQLKDRMLHDFETKEKNIEDIFNTEEKKEMIGHEESDDPFFDIFT